MDLHKFKLTVSYDGTAYFGWQKTKTGPSIQESLEKAILQITQETVLPEAASRTDRGVHAVGQVVSIALKKEWGPRVLQRALNAVLPLDIRVVALEQASQGFHPTLDASCKEYLYSLCLEAVQDPAYRLYSWAFRGALDVSKMRQAAEEFLGRHDFSGFACEAKKDPVCTLIRIAIDPLPERRLQIAIAGDRFLYKMARSIVGTLVYIGCGKLPVGAVSKILATKDRKSAGMTAPAHGLALYRVGYVE
jgi:tRNA pseudouridine38-40 synthase